MPSAIRIGSHVSGLIGPFLPLSEGQQRRKRQRFFGIVIRSIANQYWTVYWPDVDRCADHSFKSLKYEGKENNSLGGIDLESILTNKHLGKDQQLIDKFFEWWQLPATPLPTAPCNNQMPSAPRAAASGNTNQNPQPAFRASALSFSESESEPMSNPTTAPVTEQSQMEPPPPQESTNSDNNPSQPNDKPQPDTEADALEEEVFDPASIIRDIIANESAGHHLHAVARYKSEKEQLIGSTVEASGGLKWIVRADITSEDVASPWETTKPIGVKRI